MELERLIPLAVLYIIWQLMTRRRSRSGQPSSDADLESPMPPMEFPLPEPQPMYPFPSGEDDEVIRTPAIQTQTQTGRARTGQKVASRARIRPGMEPVAGGRRKLPGKTPDRPRPEGGQRVRRPPMTRKAMRQAVVWSEILAPPVGWRDS